MQDKILGPDFFGKILIPEKYLMHQRGFHNVF